MDKKDNVLDEEIYNKYQKITFQALEKAKKSEHEPRAEIIFDMVSRYLEDAQYFASKGDLIRAFAAVNYAHGWLDCGARMKIFKVKDSKLFTTDD